MRSSKEGSTSQAYRPSTIPSKHLPLYCSTSETCSDDVTQVFRISTIRATFYAHFAYSLWIS